MCGILYDAQYSFYYSDQTLIKLSKLIRIRFLLHFSYYDNKNLYCRHKWQANIRGPGFIYVNYRDMPDLRFNMLMIIWKSNHWGKFGYFLHGTTSGGVVQILRISIPINGGVTDIPADMVSAHNVFTSRIKNQDKMIL